MPPIGSVPEPAEQSALATGSFAVTNAMIAKTGDAASASQAAGPGEGASLAACLIAADSVMLWSLPCGFVRGLGAHGRGVGVTSVTGFRWTR